MLLLQITVFGFTTPGSAAVVVDDPDFGQRLWLLAMDENEVSFPYGPDWMNVAWTDKEFWSPGLQRIDRLGMGSGAIVVVDFFDYKTKKWIEHEIQGFNAEPVCEIFSPNTKMKLGQVWAIDPNGKIFSGNFELSLDASSNWNIIPMSRMQ